MLARLLVPHMYDELSANPRLHLPDCLNMFSSSVNVCKEVGIVRVTADMEKAFFAVKDATLRA